MKLLRETISRIILQEGMATMEQLPDDTYIRIKLMSGGVVAIEYVEVDENGKSTQRISYDSNDTCWGVVMIQKSMHQKGLWKVIQTGAGDGWGPLLYDIAMEYATDGGQGLVSDRYDVSAGDDGAQNVWNYYMKYRDGVDVKAHQMDDMYNTLTDTPKDNIPQDIAKQVADDDWPNSALSKRYTKEPMILNKYSDRIIYENKQAFQKELLGHPDWDEGEDDTIMVDDDLWMSQNDIPQRSRTRGRPLKQIWAKHVNRKWVQSLTYVHWADERLAWDLVMDCTAGYSKDEISCSAYLKESDITINEHFGPFGFVLEGHVSLLGQDMNEMYTGSRDELYGLDIADQMERSSGIAKGVQIATADTYILDKQDFRGVQNEALLDNWKPVALIYPKNLVRTALMIIERYKDDCDIALKGIPL